MCLSSLYRVLFAVFAICWSTSVMAATISLTGNSPYIVQGSEMDGVAGIQLDVVYDKNTLASPTVTQGNLVTGALFAANTSRPGSIKIAIVSSRAFSGSGPIATIAFASKNAAAPTPSFTVSMIDSKGAPFNSSTSNSSTETPTPVTALTVGDQSNPQPQQQSSTTVSSSSKSLATTPAYLGTVTLPADQQQQADSKPIDSSTTPVNKEEPAAPPVHEQAPPSGKPDTEAKTEETAQYIIYKGVLDRFKQYHGNKKLSDMVALFDKKVANSIKQEPAILLTDGQSKATLTVDIPARIVSSPNFAVNGGNLVSFKQDKQSKGRWIVEVLANAGVVRATVTIIAGAEEFEFPLTVSTLVKTGLTLDERGWDRFLKEVGTATSPQHDFNTDGVRDFIDEFIFVANYLAGKSTQAKPESTSNKVAK